MRRYRFAEFYSTCEEVGIDGAGRYARKKSLVKQFRCPKTCPTMGSECPAAHAFVSIGRQDTFSAKQLTAFARKYDTGVSTRWSHAWTQFSGRDEDPVFSVVSSRGHESGIFARHSRIMNSRLHFSHIDGAQTQVTNWNCIVSVRQSLFASFELHRVACLGWRKSFFEICACAYQKT